MPFVLDASVTIVWAMEDEAHAIADMAFGRLDVDTALVPAIWWYEIRNILVMNERRQRISQAQSAQFLANLDGFPISIEEFHVSTGLTELARHHHLSVYDSAYLELALRRQIPLATLDKALRAAAMTAGVELLG